MMNLRLKLTASDKPHLDRSFPVTTTVLEVKRSLFHDYPVLWPQCRAVEDMRMIFLGKELDNSQPLQEALARATVDPVTVHLHVPKREATSQPVTPTVHYPTSPVKPKRERENAGGENAMEAEEDDDEQDPHFHAVTVSERELQEFQMIFDRKKRPQDGLMSVSAVTHVLRAYWSFIHREGFEFGGGPFPQERLDALLSGMTIVNGGLSNDQFLIVFYLFDNGAPEEPCIHGDIERVRLATAQLHGVIQPDHEFYHERFEEIYRLVSGRNSDEQQPAVLTCKQMEMLYYMYSGFVLEKVRELELVSLVQAKVRMKLARTNFERKRSAARKLQTAWRQRNCRQSLINSERMVSFLRALLQGETGKQ